jgi:hypothetical protein
MIIFFWLGLAALIFLLLLIYFHNLPLIGLALALIIFLDANRPNWYP